MGGMVRRCTRGDRAKSVYLSTMKPKIKLVVLCASDKRLRSIHKGRQALYTRHQLSSSPRIQDVPLRISRLTKQDRVLCHKRTRKETVWVFMLLHHLSDVGAEQEECGESFTALIGSVWKTSYKEPLAVISGFNCAGPAT